MSITTTTLTQLLGMYGYLAVFICIAVGGIIWATAYGLGGYLLGNNIQCFTGPIGIITAALAIIVMLAFLLFFHRHEKRLEDEAEQALPGPLHAQPVKQRVSGHRRSQNDR